MITAVGLKNKKSGLVVMLPKPNRHNDVIQKIVDDYDTVQVIGSEWVQGFVTDRYEFLDRRQAAKYALEKNQIEHPADILFSEDLW